MGNDLEECKSDVFPIEKILDQKISFKASISPSNNGISKFSCTWKGVSWSLDEDASPVGSH
jgi:hypothetical protein